MFNFTLLHFFFRIPGVITLGNSPARGIIKAEGLVNFQKQMTSAMTAPWGEEKKKKIPTPSRGLSIFMLQGTD